MSLNPNQKVIKMNKFLVAFVVFLSFVLNPVSALSQDKNPPTIVMTEDNLLVLNGEVNGDSVGAIIKKAKALDLKLAGKLGLYHSTPLYLYLNSPGGSIISGLELIEALKGLGRPIHTISTFSASMSFEISQNLNTRYVLKNGIMMAHRAAGEISGSFGGQSPSQLDNRYHLWLQLTKEMDEVVVGRTGGKQTMESYQKAYANELWVTGSEAVAGGYADSLTLVKCGKGLEGTTKHNVEFLGVPIEYELSECPINSSPTNAHAKVPPGASSEYVKNLLDQFLNGFNLKANTPLPMVL